MVTPTFAKADSTTENQNLNNVEITQNISSDSNQTLTDQNTSDEGKIQVPVIPQSQSNNVDEISETGKPNTFNTINNKIYYYDNNGILSKIKYIIMTIMGSFLRINGIQIGVIVITLERMAHVILIN